MCVYVSVVCAYEFLFPERLQALDPMELQVIVIWLWATKLPGMEPGPLQELHTLLIVEPLP